MSTPVTSRSELEAKKFLDETVSGMRWDNVRPKFLEGLELDRWYPRYSLAIEFNGSQHYRFTPKFHRTRADLDAQRERDRRKRRLCKQNRVWLISVRTFEKDWEFDLMRRLESWYRKRGRRSVQRRHREPFEHLVELFRQFKVARIPLESRILADVDSLDREFKAMFA